MAMMSDHAYAAVHGAHSVINHAIRLAYRTGDDTRGQRPRNPTPLVAGIHDVWDATDRLRAMPDGLGALLAEADVLHELDTLRRAVADAEYQRAAACL